MVVPSRRISGRFLLSVPIVSPSIAFIFPRLEFGRYLVLLGPTIAIISSNRSGSRGRDSLTANVGSLGAGRVGAGRVGAGRVGAGRVGAGKVDFGRGRRGMGRVGQGRMGVCWIGRFRFVLERFFTPALVLCRCLL